MPGPSFLFKKRFHPSRIDNQKKLFIAEQKIVNREKSEQERAEEVVKEIDSNTYSLDDEIAGRDARYTSLKFMYAQPVKTQAEKEKDKELEANKKYKELTIGEDGDDEMVRKFRQSLVQKSQPSNSSSSYDGASNDFHGEEEHLVRAKVARTREEEFLLRKRKQDPSFGASAHQSALEKEAGKKRKVGLSHAELSDRFAFLKNAPMEGSFAKDIQVRHKPFNEVVRNVQCIRCGEWGHQSGDRECVLRDYNPHDFARQKREDPLTFMTSSSFLKEKQEIALRQAYADDATHSNNNKFTKDDEESDPEAEFIATLTAREKKLLLRRLEEIETGQKYQSTGASSDDDDSDENSTSSGSDSSSSSSSSSSNDGNHSKKHKKHHKKSKSKSKSSKKAKEKKKKEHKRKN